MARSLVSNESIAKADEEAIKELVDRWESDARGCYATRIDRTFVIFG